MTTPSQVDKDQIHQTIKKLETELYGYKIMYDNWESSRTEVLPETIITLVKIWNDASPNNILLLQKKEVMGWSIMSLEATKIMLKAFMDTPTVIFLGATLKKEQLANGYLSIDIATRSKERPVDGSDLSDEDIKEMLSSLLKSKSGHRPEGGLFSDIFFGGKIRF